MKKIRSVPNIVPFFNVKILYTKPKIFIPTKINEQGKKVPTVEAGKYWYVKYSFRNPKTGKLQEIREKKGINKFKTVNERMIAIKRLRKAVELYLQEGNNPFKKREENLINKTTYTVEEALRDALEEKNKVWNENTRDHATTSINVFIRFLKKNNLYQKNINLLTKKHVLVFLKGLGKEKGRAVGPTTRNNYKRYLSSVFTQLEKDEIIQKNFIENIPLLLSKPKKNTPFTKKQVKDIKDYLIKNDPYLYLFIKFVMYGFFRPVEVCRIKLKDINLNRNTISVESKTESSIANTVFITKQLKETIKEMKINDLNPQFNLFTKNFKPDFWNVPDKRRRTYFGNRFLKVKQALKLDENYGIYSFRHTASIDLFTTYINQGLTDLEAKHKMLPITRHKDINSLNKYLRDIGASLPKDYSDDYSLDF